MRSGVLLRGQSHVLNFGGIFFFRNLQITEIKRICLDQLDAIYMRHLHHIIESHGEVSAVFDGCMCKDWQILPSIGEIYFYNALECSLVGTGANAI